MSQPRKNNNENEEDIEILGEESIDSDLFDRQKRLVGWDQEKIQTAKIMVVGAGATGNELLKNLVLAGIQNIVLIDFDIINLSNLNRCILFTREGAEKGDYKVDVVSNSIKKINPNVNIEGIKTDLNSIDKNLYNECDVVCSCLDNLEARLEANNYAYFAGTPFVDSAIEGFMGTVQCVYSKVPEAACLQCGVSQKDMDLMWQKFSCTGEEISEEEGATQEKLATIVSTTSIIGGLQAQQVIKFVLGVEIFEEDKTWNPYIGAPLIGTQLIYNGIKNEFFAIEKLKDDKCWICSYQT